MRIYIAGRYTRGDRSDNVRNAMRAMDRLIAAGHEPLCPLLTHFQDLAFPRPWEDWMRIDLAWLPFSDAVVRLPGNSLGADMETEEANRWDIPVFLGLDTFFLAYPTEP